MTIKIQILLCTLFLAILFSELAKKIFTVQESHWMPVAFLVFLLVAAIINIWNEDKPPN